MTAVLGTLPFLATLWLLIVLGAAVLEESGAKIAAALKGESASNRRPLVQGRSGLAQRSQHQSYCATEPLRAAA